jgi:hypothetical protein
VRAIRSDPIRRGPVLTAKKPQSPKRLRSRLTVPNMSPSTEKSNPRPSLAPQFQPDNLSFVKLHEFQWAKAGSAKCVMLRRCVAHSIGQYFLP